MPNIGRLIVSLAATSLIAACAVAENQPSSQQPSAETLEMMAQGKQVAFDRKKGNCLACHAIAGGSLPGNIGPPLLAMKSRFPDKAVLRAQIWDPTATNPNTIMPPFGKHQILTDAEVDLVTEFIYSL